MKELISPAQSEVVVLVVAVAFAVAGAVFGYRVLGKRGLVAALLGPLVWGLWQVHKYLTRFDPQTGYLGLDKVNVLLAEVALVLVLGATLGWLWSQTSRSNSLSRTSLNRKSEEQE